MNAYDTCYLDDAQENLGCALDYAVHYRNLSLEQFWTAFLASPFCEQFCKGNPFVISGLSGYELAIKIIDNYDGGSQTLSSSATANTSSGSSNATADTSSDEAFRYAEFLKRSIRERSPEFWVGWALAYYQWHSGLPFNLISADVPIGTVLAMYRPYHEMDISAFVDNMNLRVALAHPHTRLHERRVSVGLSQSQLAAHSGVSLRTIQHYEQRSKDINRAQVDQLLRLARALYCSIDDLLEPLDKSVYEYALIQLGDS